MAPEHPYGDLVRLLDAAAEGALLIHECVAIPITNAGRERGWRCVGQEHEVR